MAAVARLVSKTGIAIVVALVASGLAGTASAATSTTDRPDPRELWNAYPLEPGQGKPKVRLPADSAPPARAPARTVRTGDGDAGGGGASTPVLLGVALLALALGAVGGLRLRRASKGAPRPSAGKTTAPPVETAPVPVAAAPAPRVAPPPPPRPAPRAPSTPIAVPAPRPAPAPPPPSPPIAAPAPAPRPAPAAPPPSRRFRRVPWPDGAESGWRCEVVNHLGVLHADFRAMAFAPGKRRPVAFARTRSHTRPGWGSELSFEEQSAMVDALVAKLRDAGWEPVGIGREWFAARFVWTGPKAPDLEEFPDPISEKERVDVR